VRVVESGSHLRRHGRRGFRRQGPMPTDAVAQRAASQVGHYEEDVIVDHSEIDDLADVGVHQLRR